MTVLEQRLRPHACLTSNIRLALSVMLLVSLVAWRPAAVRAQLGAGSYQGLADTRPASRFSDFSYPVINDAGDVAFAARLKNGGSGIYKWSAATSTLVTIFEDPATDWFNFHHSFGSPAIANNGDVIFQYEHERIRAGDGISQEIVFDSTDAAYSIPLGSLPGPFTCNEPTMRSRSADSSGRVAISCFVSNGMGTNGAGVYLVGGGPVHRICDEGSGPAPFANVFDRCFQDGPIEVNAGGTVAGIGLDNSRRDQFGLPRQLLVRGNASGLEIVLDPGVHTALAFPNRLSRIGFNDRGTITYDAFQDTPGGSGSAVFKIDTAGVPVSVTDPRNFVYREALSPSINSVGEVPFMDALRNGLFIGPDPAFDKVIARGDTIPGYAIPGVVTSVSTVFFQHPGINTLGVMTFTAFLADGTLVIARTVPPNNHPPDVSIGDQSSPEGILAQAHVTASDQDGDYPLTYAFMASPLNPPPAGTIPALPGPNFAVDSNGDITGTPAPGTAGNRYSVRITVTDSRQNSAFVDFIWTITEPVPSARLNLTAAANPVEQGIDVAWQNPSPDIANEFELLYSLTGPSGPYLLWGFGPVSTTTQQIHDALGGGKQWCFIVKGVITQGATRRFSPDSNIACAIHPANVVQNVQPSLPTVDGGVLTFTSSMPSTIAWPNLPQGAQAVVNSSDNRTFHATISGLPAPATTYNLTIEAHSIPWGVIGTATGTLTTTAPPTEPPTGSGAPGTHSRVQGPLHVRIVNEPAFVPTEDKVGFTTITVQLTNQGRTPIEGLRVLPSSTLDRPCIQTMEFCRSNPPRVLDSLISSSLGPLVVLEPGRSVLATLTFPRAFATPGGILGSPTGVLSLMVDHGAVPTSDPFVLDVVLPPPPAQLAVSSPVADRHAAIDFEADLLNYGPGAAIGVVLELIFDSPVDVSTAQAYGGLAGNGTFFQCRNTRRSQQVECSLPDFPPGFISAPGLMHLSVSLNELRRAPITVTLRLGSRTSDPDLADNTRTFVLPAR